MLQVHSFLAFLQIGSVISVVGKCNYNLVLLWSRETGHAPFAATPVIEDINMDGSPEVIAAPFADQVTVVQGHNGHVMADSKWPQQLVDNSVHASPIVYDANSDGEPDIIVPASDGHFYFFHSNGQLMNRTIKLPGLQVAKNWHQEMLNVEKPNIHSYILDKPPINDKAEEGYVIVEPHILGSAVVADMNADSIIEEMVVPVSYYFGDDYYSNAEKLAVTGLKPEEVTQFLVGAVVFVNLTDGQILMTSHLELTRMDAEYPGYVMFTPSVVDLDGTHGPLETIIGTSAGQIHIIGPDGANRKGWPVASEPINGQILVADVDLDGQLEIIAVDTSSKVMCYDAHANLMWETVVSGTGTTSPRVADIDQDGYLDIILGTDDGQVWILEGAEGKVKKQWPFRVGKGLTATPLISQLSPTSVIDVVILAEDAHLHIVSGDGKKCRHAIHLGETSLVGVLSADLVPSIPGMEFLVATRDGTLMCLGRRANEQATRSALVMDSQPAETRSANDFVYSASRMGIVLQDNEDGVLTVTGSSLDLHFDIVDKFVLRGGPAKSYKVSLYLRNKRMVTATYDAPGSYYLTLSCPTTPAQAVVTIVMTTRHGIIYRDTTTLQFNTLFLVDLQWLLISPFLAMATILLLLHGYPAVDLLPMTYRSKTS